MWKLPTAKAFRFVSNDYKKKKIMKTNVSCNESKSTSLIIVARVDRDFHSVLRTNKSWIFMFIKGLNSENRFVCLRNRIYFLSFDVKKTMSIWFQNNFLNQRAFLEKKCYLNVCVAPNSLWKFPEREGEF